MAGAEKVYLWVSVRVHAERGATQKRVAEFGQGLSQSAFMRNEGLHPFIKPCMVQGSQSAFMRNEGLHLKDPSKPYSGDVSVRVHAERGATPFGEVEGLPVRLSPRSCGTRGYTPPFAGICQQMIETPTFHCPIPLFLKVFHSLIDSGNMAVFWRKIKSFHVMIRRTWCRGRCSTKQPVSTGSGRRGRRCGAIRVAAAGTG